MLLVMCTGNVCRSPIAEALLTYYVAENRLAATVISRGLAAPLGRPPHEYAIKVAEARGIPLNPDKRAAGVSAAEMAMASVILVMDEGHRRQVQVKFPTATGKTFLLGKWQNQEIPDPINEPIEAFENVWELCNAGAKEWVRKLMETGILCPGEERLG